MDLDNLELKLILTADGRYSTQVAIRHAARSGGGCQARDNSPITEPLNPDVNGVFDALLENAPMIFHYGLGKTAADLPKRVEEAIADPFVRQIAQGGLRSSEAINDLLDYLGQRLLELGMPTDMCVDPADARFVADYLYQLAWTFSSIADVEAKQSMEQPGPGRAYTPNCNVIPFERR